MRRCFRCSEAANLFPNYFNEEVDRLIDEAQTSTDSERRLALYSRAQRLLLDDGAVVPLYQQMDVYGVNKRLQFQALPSEQLVGVWMRVR